MSKEDKTFSIQIIGSQENKNLKFKALMDASPDPIVIYDKTGKTTYMNPAFEIVYGFTPEEVIDKKINFVPEDEIEKTLDAWQRTIKGEKLYIETRRYTKAGKVLNIQMSTAIIKDKNQNHMESIIIHRDITPLKQIEQEKEKLITELKQALSRLKTLSGLLPICTSCKKIRDDKGYWNQIESYIHDHSDAKFSHSICPECSDKHYGKEDWYIEMKKKKNIGIDSY
ncbi:MAG: PAS domain S-box protein [Desulfobacteraceae bacterium]|nr:PAS domain S-box protein [Desulfobacteraceae bacterium]